MTTQRIHESDVRNFSATFPDGRTFAAGLFEKVCSGDGAVIRWELEHNGVLYVIDAEGSKK